MPIPTPNPRIPLKVDGWAHQWQGRHPGTLNLRIWFIWRWLMLAAHPGTLTSWIWFIWRWLMLAASCLISSSPLSASAACVHQQPVWVRSCSRSADRAVAVRLCASAACASAACAGEIVQLRVFDKEERQGVYQIQLQTRKQKGASARHLSQGIQQSYPTRPRMRGNTLLVQQCYWLLAIQAKLIDKSQKDKACRCLSGAIREQ